MFATTFADGSMFRVGYAPDPFAWVPWEYADRSTGRWDDSQGRYRVVYVGSSPEACFTEVLAQFRPDPVLVGDTSAIESDPRDELYPEVSAGVLPSSWLDKRRLGSGRLSGTFVDIAHKDTIATLRPNFLAKAVHFGLVDFDAAAIRLREPRSLTQEISRHLYEFEDERGPLSGVKYESRFGSGLELWAIFERSEDESLERSHLLGDVRSTGIDRDDPALLTAMELHGLALV